jgi:hypothetical protein
MNDRQGRNRIVRNAEKQYEERVARETRLLQPALKAAFLARDAERRRTP